MAPPHFAGALHSQLIRAHFLIFAEVPKLQQPRLLPSNRVAGTKLLSGAEWAACWPQAVKLASRVDSTLPYYVLILASRWPVAVLIAQPIKPFGAPTCEA